jgi:hypothetical protein
MLRFACFVGGLRVSPGVGILVLQNIDVVQL